ncbi:hypothetical protein D3C81_1291200 [compost metagenome]
MHLDLGQALENVRHLSQFDPVELDVLARGEVAVAAVVLAGDLRQGAHLPGTQGAVGDGHAQHVGMLLQVQAVLQAQGQELFFTQFASHEPAHLIAKLRHALEHQRTVILVIVIHGSDLIREAVTMAFGCTGLQIQVGGIYTDQMLKLRCPYRWQASSHKNCMHRPLWELACQR